MERTHPPTSAAAAPGAAPSAVRRVSRRDGLGRERESRPAISEGERKTSVLVHLRRGRSNNNRVEQQGDNGAARWVPPVLQEFSIMPTNELDEDEVELEEKGLLCKRKRHKLAGSIVHPEQKIEILDIESKNKESADPSLEVSAYVLQSNDEASGCSEVHVHGDTSKEPAAWSRLNELCSAIGWKYPTYNFEEQGPPHTKMFTCKVTVYVESITDTVVECLGEAKPEKKAAQEHAAQGVLWCLKQFLKS